MASTTLPFFCALRSPWLWWSSLLITALGIAGVSWLWSERLYGRVRLTRAAVTKLEQEVAPSLAAVPTAADFVGTLPRTVNAQTAVDILQRAARDAGITVASVSLRESMPKPEQLGRLEITVVAQGAYPTLKQALADWLARFPSATVRSQQWRRQDGFGVNANDALIEASWVLSLWAAPSGFGTPGTSAANPPLPVTSTSSAGQPVR